MRVDGGRGTSTIFSRAGFGEGQGAAVHATRWDGRVVIDADVNGRIHVIRPMR
jgi:hypothetical protein